MIQARLLSVVPMKGQSRAIDHLRALKLFFDKNMSFDWINLLLSGLLPSYLTPWSRVLFEKLTGSHLVGKFHAFYGTPRIINAFTTVRHLSLSWARSIQSMPPSHFLKIHLNIILPSTPGSSKSSLSLRLSTKTLYAPLSTCYIPRPSHSSRFNHPNNIWWGVQIIKVLCI